MMKIDEQNIQAGNSLLLHLMTGNIWTSFSAIRWRAVRCVCRAAEQKRQQRCLPSGVRCDQQGRPVMRYIDQFVQPKDLKKACG